MKQMKKIVVMLTSIVLLNGCSAINTTSTIEIHEKMNDSESIKKIALFLDGTANDRRSRTNVLKINEIIANQNKDNLYLFYNEGVGTGYRALGAGTGWGLGKDVREAYQFLSEHYTKDTSLYIFGFSRGSYTARVLAGMIYTVGIYNLSEFNKDAWPKIIYDLYNKAYKGSRKTKENIRESAISVINDWRKRNKTEGGHEALDQEASKRHIDGEKIKIEIMALWDTVEAMGIVPTMEAIKDKLGIEEDKQDIVYPNDNYTDQICNMNHVLHALSLDDNRAYVFTPIILTNERVIHSCEGDINIQNVVNEVWFSGAHADVGGGYEKNNSLSGVSLNWMLDEINKIEKDKGRNNRLLSENVEIFGNELGFLHNAEGKSKLYREDNRRKILEKYLGASVYEVIRIHSSVKRRLEKIGLVNGFDSKWYESERFDECFSEGGKNKFKNCTSIVIVE
jgi:uncharacterized protein (DUF2235 family)